MDVDTMTERALLAARDTKLISLDDTDIPSSGYLIPAGMVCVNSDEYDQLRDAITYKPDTIHFAFGTVVEDVSAIQFLEHEETQVDALVRLKYWRDCWKSLGMPMEELNVQFGGILPIGIGEITEVTEES